MIYSTYDTPFHCEKRHAAQTEEERNKESIRLEELYGASGRRIELAPTRTQAMSSVTLSAKQG